MRFGQNKIWEGPWGCKMLLERVSTTFRFFIAFVLTSLVKIEEGELLPGVHL